MGAATLMAGEITSRSVKAARSVVPASIAEGPLDAVERRLGRRRDEARKSEKENRDNVAEAAESVLNRVVVGVVEMLDMEQLIDHVPINKVVARVDLPGVIDEVDLVGVIRESTTGLGAETLDASRAGLMAMDLWSARLVDRILRRKQPRDLAGPVEWHCSTGERETRGPLVSRHLEIRSERAAAASGPSGRLRFSGCSERDGCRSRSLCLCRWGDHGEHCMGSLFFEVDFDCGSTALVERTAPVDPSRRVLDRPAGGPPDVLSGSRWWAYESSVRMGVLFGSGERSFERSFALHSSRRFCWPW